MTEVRIAFDAGNYLGEGPVWSEREQALWWINCEHPAELHRWEPGTNVHRTWPMPRRIGGYVHTDKGGALVALADGLYDLNLDSGSLTLRASSPFPAHVNLHEAGCDRQGRFWIGAYDQRFPADRAAADGAICRLDGDQLVPMIEGISVANGLAFSPDGTTLYVADSPRRRVDAYDLDPGTGELGQCRTFLTLEEGQGFIDGATIDADGAYWLANVGAGALRRYLPDGKLDRIVSLPFANPTKPAFGGPDLKTLFITTTRLTMQQHTTPTAPDGPVYAIVPGEMGILDTPLASGG